MAILRRKSAPETSSDRLASEIAEETTREKKEERVEFLHSGSIVLNEAASSKGRGGGFARGRIINLVGDKSSGKTALALELAAHFFHKIKKIATSFFPTVKSVRIRYVNAEIVMDFPIKTMYGEEFVEAVEWPNDVDDEDKKIDTVEKMGRDIARTIRDHRPGEALLYIVDSLDALTSEAAKKRFADAAQKEKEEDGSYGTEKAKYLSQSFFNNLCSLMAGKDITIIIISQLRQKIGVTFGEKYTRTGGKAMDFYAHQVAWLAEVEKLKKTYLGEERVYGIRTLVKFKKNKAAKPFREAEVVILFDYGIDDLGSSITWLYGPKVKQITFDGNVYTREELIAHLEDNHLEHRLAALVEEKWEKIEQAMEPNRKNKFDEE